MSRGPQLKILRQQDLEPKVGIVVGTRPGIVMFSPIIRELQNRKLDFFIIHTGQHYSSNMDRRFFDDLHLPKPQYHLDTVQYCQYHGEQTAEMIKGCEKALLEERPKIVLVGGDANTNLAGALAARKLHVKVGHVEAGERSYDWRMPEEHNRVIIDHISDYLFTTNEKGRANLAKDGVQGQVFVTGNPIVDAAYQNLEVAREKSDVLSRLGLINTSYFMMTLHREGNVDSLEDLRSILSGLRQVTKRFGRKIVFLAHPRTLRRMREFGLEEMAQGIPRLEIQEAVGYLDFLKIISAADLVLTDSGGVQQESCILKVPCVTLRDNTEWTETIESGANRLAGSAPDRIVASVEAMLESDRDWDNPFGDGRSATRIIQHVAAELSKKGTKHLWAM